MGKAQKDPYLLTPIEARELLLEGKNRREGAAGWRWGMGACPAPPGL